MSKYMSVGLLLFRGVVACQSINILDHNVSSTPGMVIITVGGSQGSLLFVQSCISFLPKQGIGVLVSTGAYTRAIIVDCSNGMLALDRAIPYVASGSTVNHDETDALSALMPTSTNIPTTLYVPNVGAPYNISYMLANGNTQAGAFNIKGDGPGTVANSSAFKAMDSMRAMIHLTSWTGSTIDGIGWDGNGLAPWGIWIDSKNNTKPVGATYQDVIQNNLFIRFVGAGSTAIQIGDPDSCIPTPQISEIDFIHDKFYGDGVTSENAIRNACGGNIKNFRTQMNIFSRYATPLMWVAQATSSIRSDHDGFLASRLVDISMLDGGTLVIDGGWSENSAAWVHVGCGGCQIQTTWSANGFSWIGNSVTTDVIVVQDGAATGKIEGCALRNGRTDTSLPLIQTNGRPFVSIANDYWNASNSALPWTGTASTIGDQGSSNSGKNYITSAIH